MITIASNIHLNIDQNMVIKSRSASISVKGVSDESLPNQAAKLIGLAEIRLPNNIPIDEEMQNRSFLRVRSTQVADASIPYRTFFAVDRTTGCGGRSISIG